MESVRAQIRINSVPKFINLRVSRPVRRGGAGGAVCTPPNPTKKKMLLKKGHILVQL